MNVLSLFDGMSCGQIALERSGVKVDNYYAAEIDKYAMKVTQANYPNTIQLGDVCQVKAADLPKIDILIGGSPCQGFSFAGKGLNFNDPRSALFFEFVRLLKECKPRFFLLENVVMKQESEDIISEHLGTKPIRLNSAIVSAQNRKRLYWTNIKRVFPPEDKRIVIADILEDDADGIAIKNRGEYIPREYKTQCLDANYYKGIDNHGARTAVTIKQTAHGNNQGNLFYDKSPTLTSNSWEQNNKLLVVGTTKPGSRSQDTRVYSITHKSPSIIATTYKKPPNITSDLTHYRKLTPLECERLQTVPDNYTNHVSNTQRYKMLGNGWTVDIICIFFGAMKQQIEREANENKTPA